MWFKKPKLNSGALPDSRSTQERQRDYSFEELPKSSPVIWYNFDEWRINNENLLAEMKVHDQNGSSSCVANTIANICSILNFYEEGKWLQFSARWIYPRRANFPAEGMSANDAAHLFIEHGGVFECLLPGDLKTEQQMNQKLDALPSYDTIGKIYTPDSYVWNLTNIDAFAEAIQKNKAVMTFVKFGNGEWNHEVPIIKGDQVNYYHSVTALGYFIYKGKKAILILDSWGVTSGSKGLRIVTEDWFNANRVYTGVSFIDLPNKKFTKDTIIPKYTFNKDLEYGMRNNDVKKLQEVLREMGFFPNIEPTGNYFGITVNAVMDFQLKHKVIKTKQDEGAGRFGPKTRKLMNELIA